MTDKQGASRVSEAEGAQVPGRQTLAWVTPEELLRQQRAKHADIQVHQLGGTRERSYMVIGHDERWNEVERTWVTEAGRILGWWGQT